MDAAVLQAVPETDDAEQDNGFLDPALTDVLEEKVEDDPELTFEEKIDRLERTVTRHPLNREILYRILAACSEERELSSLEDEISTYPEFADATRDQYHLIMSLVTAGGLALIERDSCDEVVLPDQKEGLDEDEVDDLVCTIGFVTTDAGRALVEMRRPSARLAALLGVAPDRRDTYLLVLDFLGESPRTYPEVEKLLEGTPLLDTYVDGVLTRVKPSMFLDKLERTGVVVWDGAWTLTEEGEAYLEEMNDNGR